MGRPGVYVQDLYVEDEFRGRRRRRTLCCGMSRGMPRSDGGAYLRLSVDSRQSSARRAFYERLGLDWSDDEQIHADLWRRVFDRCADAARRQ